jgi:hypothetical protein
MRTSDQVPYRILQYDYARGECVRKEYVRHLLVQAARMGYNGLALYCEDLTMFDMPSRYRGSLRLTDLLELDREARDLGLVLWPFLASYSHVERTLRNPWYRGLAEHGSTSTLCPDKPGTRRLLRRVYQCVAENFRGPFVHIGFDEAWEAGSLRRHQNSRGAPARIECFLEFMQWAVAAVEKTSRRAMIWGDFIGWYYPSLMSRVPRRTVILDWQYDQLRRWPSARRWREVGFDVMLGPSTGSGWNDNIFPCLQPAFNNLVWAGEWAFQDRFLGYVATSWAQGFQRFEQQLPHAAAGVAAAMGRDPWAAFRKFIPSGWTLRDYEMIDRLARGWSQFLRYRSLPRYAHFVPALHRSLKINPPSLLPMARKIRAARPVVDHAVAARFEMLERFIGRKATVGRNWKAEMERAWTAERRPEDYETNEGNCIRRLEAAIRQPRPVCTRKAPLTPLRFRVSLSDRFFAAGGDRPAEPSRMSLRWHSEGLEIDLECRKQAPLHMQEDSCDLALTYDDAVETVWASADHPADGVWYLVHPSGRLWMEGWGDVQRRDDDRKLISPALWMKASLTGRSKGWGFRLILPWILLGHSTPDLNKEWHFGIRRRDAGVVHSGWGMSSVWLGWPDRDHPSMCRRIGRKRVAVTGGSRRRGG